MRKSVSESDMQKTQAGNYAHIWPPEKCWWIRRLEWSSATSGQCYYMVWEPGDWRWGRLTGWSHSRCVCWEESCEYLEQRKSQTWRCWGVQMWRERCCTQSKCRTLRTWGIFFEERNMKFQSWSLLEKWKENVELAEINTHRWGIFISRLGSATQRWYST